MNLPLTAVLEAAKNQSAKPFTLFRIRRYSGEAKWCVLRTRSVRFRLTATYFLCAQKVGKNAFRGENTDSTSGAKGAPSLIVFSP